MFNWIDSVILVITGIYVLKGWEEGLAKLGVGVVSFVGALWFSIRYHLVAATFLSDKFGIPALWSGVLGYIIVWSVSEMLIGIVAGFALNRLPQGILASRANRYLGSVFSALKALVLTAIIMLVILALPLQGSVKQDISNSKIGSYLVKLAEKYGGQVKSELDLAVKQTTQFLTVKPVSTEKIDLGNVVGKDLVLTVNEKTERDMLDLVNAERTKAGVKTLTMDTKLIVVARNHSRDMFERKYFSHISPEGKDVGDRLEEAKVDYQMAGENLAYAPNVKVAHEGLMNSEGHKKNILSADFTKVGIGIIDGGSSGMMFTQVFTN